MMRKPRPLKVEEYPPFRRDHEYLVQVHRVRASGKTQQLRVTLVHRDHEQDGREQELELPLPIRPAGRTAQFFRACGVDVCAGAEVDPVAVRGSFIHVRFEQTELNGQLVPSFRPVVKEHEDGPTAEQPDAPTAPETPQTE